MYKKAIALSLSAILTASLAFTPVFAAENQNVSIISKQGQNGVSIKYPSIVIKYDKKDNKNKHDKDDDYKELLENMMKRFTDSSDYNWAEKSIEKLAAMGIFSGNGKGNFMPKSNLTHAEAIAMVLRLSGYQKEAEAIRTQPEYFKGLCDPWSYGYLKIALDKGIIIPEEDGKFNPMTPAKRHEVAKYVVRALGKRDLALQHMSQRLDYKDAKSIPANSVGYVYVISDLKIMQGSKNEFQPNKPITRAEMAVILDKAEDKTDEPGTNPSRVQGSFVSYDRTTSKLTLMVNNRATVYDVNPYVPVYKNSSYLTLDSLKVGDVIRVVLDGQRKVIFVEFKEDAPTNPVSQKLAIQTVQYDSLPQTLKDRLDVQKLTQGFTAYRYEQSIYLIATRGTMPTGGYSIDIQDVYKEFVQTGKFNLKAVVSMTNPGAFATQVISYPYEVIKFNYFEGIDKINFVNESNTLLAQTTLTSIGINDVVNGRIDAIDAANRLITVLEYDGNRRTYLIPANVEVTLNNAASTLSALVRNMPIAITRVNGVITRVAAQSEAQIIETLTGRIDAIDATNRIVRVLENDGIIRAYAIPANVEITLNNQAVALTALAKDMTIIITKTNSVITRIAATGVTDVISGKIDSIDTTNRILRVLENDGIVRSYSIPANVEITLNNQAVALTALVRDMPVVLTRTNGIISRLAATYVVETITGKIDSVDTTNSIVRMLENDNTVRAYAIPANTSITLNNEATTLSALTKDMNLTITRTNGVVTRLAAQNNIQMIEGIFVTTYVSQNKTYVSVKVGETINSYEMPSNTLVYYNNALTTIQGIPFNSTILLKLVNGTLVEVRNKI